MSSLPLLILPGIRSSGPEHWQSLWGAKHPQFRRVQQRDWDHPERSEWVSAR
jgi:predicted alpha/beta hydrolase family esterase